MPEFTVKLDGFDAALKEFGHEMQPKLIEAARIAINDTARWSLKFVSADMEKEVNFPTGYLKSSDRIRVSRFASNNMLEADIYARFEPTSLARFALNSESSDGIMVSVKRGNGPKLIKKAFIYGLKKGQVSRGNNGLVVRSKTKPKDAYKPKQMGGKWPDLWLLYGPSVYQVFRVSMDRFAPEIQKELERRFAHQRDRLLK